jgi:hypothetical protein
MLRLTACRAWRTKQNPRLRFNTMASPNNPVAVYLASVQKELQRGDATEHTHRSALKSLIESAAR